MAAAIARTWSAFRRPGAAPHWLLLKLRAIESSQVSTIRIGGASILVAPVTSSISEACRDGGVYEPSTSAAIHALLQQDMVVVDVGANIGYFTVLFAELVGELGQVIAFEPSEEVYGFLGRNVVDNALSQVDIVRCAVGREAGRLPLYYAVSDTTHSLGQTQYTTGIADTVDVVTLDEYFGSKLPRLDLVKIDVEGGELPVLEGANNLISIYRPFLIVEASELSAAFGYGPEAISKFFAERDYQLLALDHEDPLAWTGDLEGETYTNLLAVPFERRSAILGVLRVLADLGRQSAPSATDRAGNS